MSTTIPVATSVSQRRTTVDELEALDPDGKEYELYDGMLRKVEGVSFGHGFLEGRLTMRVGTYVENNRLGAVLTSDTRFVLDAAGPTAVMPDLAFVAAGRVPPEDLWGKPAAFAPDLAVEIVSPSNRGPQLLDKVARYLAAGTRLVWVVRREARTITVFAADAGEQVLKVGDVLDGGDVLPGFRLPLADLFAF